MLVPTSWLSSRTDAPESGFFLQFCFKHTGLTHHSDYKDDGTNILLDANENAYGPGLAVDSSSGKLQNASSNGETSLEVDLLGLNRYPDPYIPSTLLHL